MVSGGIKRDQWHEMGEEIWNLQKIRKSGEANSLDEVDICKTCSFLRLFPEYSNLKFSFSSTQRAINCSKLTIETLEQSVKYVRS